MSGRRSDAVPGKGGDDLILDEQAKVAVEDASEAAEQVTAGE